MATNKSQTSHFPMELLGDPTETVLGFLDGASLETMWEVSTDWRQALIKYSLPIKKRYRQQVRIIRDITSKVNSTNVITEPQHTFNLCRALRTLRKDRKIYQLLEGPQDDEVTQLMASQVAYEKTCLYCLYTYVDYQDEPIPEKMLRFETLLTLLLDKEKIKRKGEGTLRLRVLLQNFSRSGLKLPELSHLFVLIRHVVQTRPEGFDDEPTQLANARLIVEFLWPHFTNAIHPVSRGVILVDVLRAFNNRSDRLARLLNRQVAVCSREIFCRLASRGQGDEKLELLMRALAYLSEEGTSLPDGFMGKAVMKFYE